MLANESTPTEVVIEHIVSLGVDPSRIETNNIDIVLVINDQDAVVLFVDIKDVIKVKAGIDMPAFETTSLDEALVAVDSVIKAPGINFYNPHGE